jgi:hypothetical protein
MQLYSRGMQFTLKVPWFYEITQVYCRVMQFYLKSPVVLLS